jgi:hypothetical protein
MCVCAFHTPRVEFVCVKRDLVLKTKRPATLVSKETYYIGHTDT